MRFHFIIFKIDDKFFVFSLPCCSYSGSYVFDIMDTYGGGLGVLWLAIFETICIMWIYGVQRFADDMGFMLNTKVNWYWKVSRFIFVNKYFFQNDFIRFIIWHHEIIVVLYENDLRLAVKNIAFFKVSYGNPRHVYVT